MQIIILQDIPLVVSAIKQATICFDGDQRASVTIFYGKVNFPIGDHNHNCFRINLVYGKRIVTRPENYDFHFSNDWDELISMIPFLPNLEVINQEDYIRCVCSNRIQ